MEIKSAITILNRSNAEQYIIVDGERHSIGPLATKVVDADIAAAFTETCSPYVIKKALVNMVTDDIPIKDRIYLFNTTGNPLSSKTMKIQKMTKEGMVEEEILNPKYNPLVIRQEKGGAQEVVVRGGEETALNMPSRTIEIYPYSRMAFDKGTADWLLNRDQTQSKEMRGCLAHSRGPQAFEPDETWDLLELQEYALTVDSAFNIGKKADTLSKSKAKNKEELIDKEKDLMLRKLFFVIANPKYRLPSKEEFAQIMEKYNDAEDVQVKSA